MDLADYLGAATGVAGTVLGALHPSQNSAPAAAAPAPVAAPASSWTQYLPWIGGAVALLVVVLLIAKR
ncbi:MAG: hypothetical protein NT154_08250 [Verrucomicrobia bacterium]|nr:hypothetical protein [Verrucomicrobiota bacterium]